MIKKIVLLTLLGLSTSFFLTAQLTLPPSGGNQKTIITQYIGSVAHVSIIYNSPAVRGREGHIWGELVPWGLAPNNFGTAASIPWRAGANENTVFEISHDMLVNGKLLPAGKYGFHIVPNESKPWILIFSKASAAWGSYFYEEAEDVLRVEATPAAADFNEYLDFKFIDRKPDYTIVALEWENLSLPIKFEVVDNENLQIAAIREELKGDKGFMWQNYVTAINFCLSLNSNLEEALEWAETALEGVFVGERNFQTLSAKAAVLNALGRNSEGDAVMDEAIRHPSATAFQIHNYGRQLLNSGNKNKAVEIMRYNYDKNDGAWPTAVGMMRALAAVEQFDEALKYAEIALEQAPDDLNRNYIQGAVNRLREGKALE